MAWTSPATFSDGSVLTAAQLNTNLRDNLNETAVAKATAAGQVFVSTASNALAARVPTSNVYAGGGTDTTNSTTYTGLTGGGAVTVTTGSQAIVSHWASVANDTAGSRSYASYAVTGATTISSSDTWAIVQDISGANRVQKCGLTYLHTGLTAGSNTFTQQFKVSGNTGSFTTRGINVFPL
jgi:hypothetical protein